MYNLIAYISAAEPLGAVRDAYNAKNAAAPTMIIGVGTTLKLRLFADAEGQTGYPLDALTAISSWRWIMDSDWDSATVPPIVADNADITVATVTDDINGSQMTFTEVTIPISNLNSAELQTLLGSSETVSGLNGQLTGYDENGEAAFILQIKNFSIRNRLDAAGEPVEIDPEWLNEAQVRALISTAAPRISADNTWIVNGIDTGISAEGPQGEPGAYLQPVTVTDSTVTSAYIPVLNGGKQYRFEQPLTSLEIGSAADTTQEDEIIFTAGAIIVPPAAIAIYGTAGTALYHDNPVTTGDDTDLKVPLLSLSADSGFQVVSSGSVYGWNGDYDEYFDWTMSAAIVQDGNNWVLSCSGTNSAYYQESEDIENEDGEMEEVWHEINIASSSYSGVFASSTDGGFTWEVVDSSCMRWAMATVDWAGTDDCTVAFSKFTFDNDGSTVPCTLTLPAEVRLLGSSAVDIETGKTYVLNFKDAILASGEIMEQGE